MGPENLKDQKMVARWHGPDPSRGLVLVRSFGGGRVGLRKSNGKNANERITIPLIGRLPLPISLAAVGI